MNTKTIRELHDEEETEARDANFDRLIADMGKKQREWEKQQLGMLRFPIRFFLWLARHL